MMHLQEVTGVRYELPIPSSVVTHSGTFHADDVFGVALLKILNSDLHITRSRDEEIIANAELAFDLSMQFDPANLRFDHHQESAPVRENGIKYCGFGQMWQFYGVRACLGNENVAKKIDQKLVQQIDAGDNGQNLFTTLDENVSGIELSNTDYPYDVTTVIDDYNPPKDYNKPPTATDFNSHFFDAVKFAKLVLKNLIKNELAKDKNREIAREILVNRPNQSFAVFENVISLGSLVDEFPELLYTISYNKAADNWKVLALNDSDKQFQPRKRFPESWGGLRDEELVKASGIESANFCHIARFLFVCKTKDDAIKVAELASSS
jgi:uncharacterized UPF0160 family protein